jgi:hypothetical protein
MSADSQYDGTGRPGTGDDTCIAHLADRGGMTAHAPLSPS